MVSFYKAMATTHRSLCGSPAISVAPWLPLWLPHSLSGSLSSSEAFPWLTQWSTGFHYREGIGWPGLPLFFKTSLLRAWGWIEFVAPI